MRAPRILSSVSFATLLALAGCEKRSGDAVIVRKEHIAAGEKTSSPAPAPSESPINEEEAAAGLPKGTIAVGPYVMKPEDRGTSRDPRALPREQWLITVKMIQNLRIIDVQATAAQFAKLREGDRVRVSYKTGRYTGTVWDAEIN